MECSSCKNISFSVIVFMLAACGGGGGGSAGDDGGGITDTNAPITSASRRTGYFGGNLSVVLSCSDAGGSGCAATYYTTDGSDPSPSSATYTSPIAVSDDTTLKFYSVDNSRNQEGIQAETYTLTRFSRTIADNIDSVSIFEPFFNVAPYFKYQFLYTATQVAGSGYIDALSFIRSEEMTSDVTCDNTIIRMGYSPLSTLEANFSYNIQSYKGAAQTVLDNTTISIPAGATGELFEIKLDRPFYYNGVDSLVVEMKSDGACTANVNIYHENVGLGNNQKLFNYSDAVTGFLANYLPHTQFRFRGGDEVVIDEVPDINGAPFASSNGKVQLLYYSDEINGKGIITGIGFPVGLGAGSPTSKANYTLNVRLGHTTLSDLTADFDNNFSTPPVTMANNISYQAPGGLPDDTYIWIPMPDGKFEYNGTDNLLIEIEVTSASGLTYLKWRYDTKLRRAVGVAGSATALAADNLAYGLKLRFAGSSIDIITDGAISEDRPFHTSANTVQHLFHASELGTGGVINKIAYRLDQKVSATESYNDCRIMLGHATGSVLGDTSFSGNMVDRTMVLSGNINIPASLAGDWFEIPLTTPFVYDSAQNLVVELACASGTAIVSIDSTITNATYRPQREAINYISNTDDLPDEAVDQMVDFRMWVE